MQAELNIKGEKTGRTIELPDDIFGVEPNEHVVYPCCESNTWLAQHQGTHKVKTRAESQVQAANSIARKVGRDKER
jgi:large subunit ribosomal protein L4